MGLALFLVLGGLWLSLWLWLGDGPGRGCSTATDPLDHWFWRVSIWWSMALSAFTPVQNST